MLIGREGSEMDRLSDSSIINNAGAIAGGECTCYTLIYHRERGWMSRFRLSNQGFRSAM